MDQQRLALPAPQQSPPVSAAIAAGLRRGGPGLAVLRAPHAPPPLLNPHLLLKPKTLTLSLSSSSLASMASSSPLAPATDALELVTPTTNVVAHVDGGLDDCAIFPPRLHGGLGLEGSPMKRRRRRRNRRKSGRRKRKRKRTKSGFGGWRWERCRLAARRAWAAGVRAVQEGVLAHGACGCRTVRPAVLSAAAAAVVVGALLYARRRDRRERDLLVLLSKEKEKRIAQLLHQFALIGDIRSGSEAVKIIRNS